MVSRKGLQWPRLPSEDFVALPPATQAKPRSHVEDQVEWLQFGASDASDYASLLLKSAYSSGNMGIVRVLYRPLTFSFLFFLNARAQADIMGCSRYVER